MTSKRGPILYAAIECVPGHGSLHPSNWNFIEDKHQFFRSFSFLPRQAPNVVDLTKHLTHYGSQFFFS